MLLTVIFLSIYANFILLVIGIILWSVGFLLKLVQQMIGLIDI